MNYKNIFSIIEQICFSVTSITIVITVMIIISSFIKTKNTRGTYKEKQKNLYYRYSLKELPKSIIFEFVILVCIFLFLGIINFDTNNLFIYINKNTFIYLCIEIFLLINCYMIHKKYKEARYLSKYIDYLENFKIHSTHNNIDKYDYSEFFVSIGKDKRYLEYCLDCANKDYEMIKFLSPIPFLSLLVEIIFKYLKIRGFNFELFTAIIIAMIFLYIILVVKTNRRIKCIIFDLYRNNERSEKSKNDVNKTKEE